MKRQDIITYYECFYKAFNNRVIYAVDNSEYKSFDTFLNLINTKYSGSFGYNSLYSYMSFQFTFWHTTKYREDNKMKVVVADRILGKKAFKRYLDRDKSMDFLTPLRVREYFDISHSYIQSMLEEEPVKSKLNVSEERIKQLIPEGNERRLINCIEHTTLYIKTSTTCFNCPMKEQCIQVQKDNLPSIYNQRNQ